MELKPCKACKNQVSSIAPMCPTCGVPLPGVDAKKDEKKEDSSGLMPILIFGFALYLSYKIIQRLFY